MTLLQFILIFPLINILLILLTSFVNSQIIHSISLYCSAISFLTSILLWLWFNKLTANFQFEINFAIFPFNNFKMIFGLDGISIFLIILTNMFIYLCILSLSSNQINLRDFLIFLFILQWGMLCAFSVLDILGFFIFFETTLIPIFLIILIWGSRERKVRAGYLIAIYTLSGSVFMFFNILYILSKTGTTDYQHLLTILFSKEEQKFLWITFFLAFAIKIPLFPLHIWLPEAHVEAPTVGSVILAALLLKLGTYGIIRFSLPLFPYGTLYFKPLINTFAVIGIIYTCFTAIRQIDLKKIIAYSSIGHMSVVLLGILSLTPEGLEGAIFQMLSHGIVSGALFFCVGFLYDRYGVRSLKYFGGLTVLYPIMSLIFLTFSIANISFPGTSSFVGEFLIFSGLFNENPAITFLAATSMILGGIYTLWTYNRVFFGNLKNIYIKYNVAMSRKELYLFSFLITSLFFLGICAQQILDSLHTSCMYLIEYIKLQ